MFRNIFTSKNKNEEFDLKTETHNVVESFSKAKLLFKELIQKAHPDKHKDKTELATDISCLLNENRYNYARLIELKKRVEFELFS